MAEERLQKILSRAGVCSRRKAEAMIEAGEITVNGEVARLGDRANPRRDAIKVAGRRIPPPAPQRYILVHKPSGFVSTLSDPEGRQTVLDLVPAGMRKALRPVGRLDYHSEGLLLMTTDGDWAQQISHPRHGCLKTYEVKVKGVPQAAQVDRLSRGMWIDGRRTSPARVGMLRTTKRAEEGNSWWEVVLGEGQNRQIREMFFRIGHPVQRLRRVAIGRLRDDNLARGGWRELTRREVGLLSLGGGGPSRRRDGSRSPRSRNKGSRSRRNPRR